VVTLVGVAYRGNIALEDIAVDFEVEPTFANDDIGFGVRESVTLYGKISESERVRLERASGHCPVGQALTKGSIQVEDEFRWSTGETVSASPPSEDLHPLDGDLPAIPFGTVHAKYLLDTKEHDETGAMTHEGEAKVTVRCANLTRSSGWIILGGHSFQGWVPGPFPLAHAGWAASTVATLGQLLPQNPGEIRVELFMAPSSRGRSESQSNAAEGVVGHRQVFRRITVPGTPENTPLSVVRAALLRDPISIAYQHGGVLLDHTVLVG
jgi:hypothetical protein